MKPSKTLTTTLLLFCLGAMSHQALASRVDAPVRPKQARPITLSSTQGFDDVEYIMGNYNNTQKLRISEAGSYKLTLKDNSKRPFKKMGARFTFSKGGKVANLTHGGSVIFDLKPGLYDLSYFAKTYKPRKSGKFSISLKPYVTDVPPPAAVPVPAAAWLFGSGLLGLAGLMHRRA